MLTPEKILQIDATVVAGLLILLTIGSFQSVTDSEQKMDAIRESVYEEFRPILEENQKDAQAINKTGQDIERIVQEISQLNETKISDQERKLQLEQDLEQLKQEQESLIQNATEFINENSKDFIEFLERSDEAAIRKKLIEMEKEERYSLITPEVWPWILGFGFATSALAAIIASITEKYRETKKIFFYIPYGFSLVLMGGGFVSLLTIFYVIFSYHPFN